MLKIYVNIILIIQTVILLTTIKCKNIRNLEEMSNDIVILHINDAHCAVNDTLGYDGFVLYRDLLEKEYKNIITVDVGGHIQGGVLGAISDGSAIINIMNKVGFDVTILGNHDFDYGIEQLNKLGENITSKYICANFCYRKNKTTIFEPYKIIEKGGKKIAFIGILTPLTLSKTYLSTIKDSNGELLYDFLTDNNTQELYDTIQKYINEVKNDKKADYVILLTHLGMKEEKYTSDYLLSKLENVDAILDGHTHKVYNVTSKDKNGKDIIISQTGTKLQSIGKLIIKTNGTITTEIISEIPEPSNKTNATNISRSKKNIWVNKEMNDFIDNEWNEYSDELNIIYGHYNYDLIIKPEDSKDSSSIYCRYKECTLGNLISDAVKNAGNAEIAIVNGGSIRNNMYKGNLTRRQLIEILPFFESLEVKRLTGQTILDTLEFGVSKLPLSSGSFPQVSGITYDVDTSFNSTVLTDENGIFKNITGKRRVSNVKINGENLVLNRTYDTCLRGYMSHGGDGYSMLAEFDVLNESLYTDTDALCNFINTDLNGEIPVKYKDSQRRINMINTDIIPNSSNSIQNDTEILPFFPYKKNSGLSSGSIVAIVLPLVAAFIIIAVTALVCLNKSYKQFITSESNTQINKI